MFATCVVDAEYASEVLHGGTVGEVCKVSGKASTKDGAQPFSLVLKNQRKWDRHGDPGCWRREYDIYKDGLDRRLFPSIKMPRCYLLEETADSTHIWMEYVEGATGSEQLGAPELALTAERLGELQAEFHLNGQRDLPYMRNYPAVRSSFDLWWRYMREPLSAGIDGFPDEVRQTLNDYAVRADALLDSFDNLPITLCQGDVHHDNLIFRETPDGPDIYLIDWDSAGYGRMGEDAVDVLMEAFVYSSRPVSLLPDFRRRILEGYCRGAREHGVDLAMSNDQARDTFALAWGFRIACDYLSFHKKGRPTGRSVEILQAMLKPDWDER
jgi:tRNA A-37 threonylcarbamoyl transferase component Bud32